MKTKEQMLIDGIKEKLAQDSSSAAKQHAGIDYADFFYSTYDTGFENQKICIERMTGILGLDYDSCVKIQDPVRALYKAVGLIGAVNKHIEQLHRDVSGIIQGQLLSNPPKQTPTSVSQTTPTKQIEQNKYISEFASQFGMDEINSDILLTRLKTSTGAWPTRESKNIVKTHYGNWFQGNYGMDTANVKILDVRCIKIFQAPKDHNLTILTLTNYVIDDSYSPYIADMLKGNNCPNLTVFNLSNNHFTDPGVKPIAEAVGSGGTSSLRGLDFHGNKLTGVGYTYFAKALENPKTQDIAVTLEVHNDKGGVLNFIKQAAGYMFKQHAQTVGASHNAELLVYGDGDWAHCKKVLVDLSRAVSVGLIHKVTDKDTIQKMKLAVKNPRKDIPMVAGGILLAVAKDSADTVVNADGARCMAAINNFLGFSTITNTDPPHLGEFYDMDAVFHDM